MPSKAVGMGCSNDTGPRKAVARHPSDPRVGMLRQFADAAGIPIEELVAGKRAVKAKK